MSEPKFTPTEQRMVDMLSDGQAHPRKELLTCIDNDQATFTDVKQHLGNIRRKLKPLGQNVILTSVNRVLGYQHVWVLNGKTPESRG